MTSVVFFSILCETVATVNCLVTNLLLNILLCVQPKKKNFYTSETTWGWDDTNVIFRWTTPLTIINLDCDCHILYLLSVWTEKWLITGNSSLGQCVDFISFGFWQMHWCVCPWQWHAFPNHSCANIFYLLRGRMTFLSSIFVFVVSKWCKCTNICYTL